MIPVDELFNQGEYRFIPDVDRASVEFKEDIVKTTKSPEVKKKEENKDKRVKDNVVREIQISTVPTLTVRVLLLP